MQVLFKVHGSRLWMRHGRWRSRAQTTRRLLHLSYLPLSSSIEKTNEESYFNKKPLNVSLQWEKTIVPGAWNPTSILALRAARVQCVAEHDRVGRAVRRPRLG